MQLDAPREGPGLGAVVGVAAVGLLGVGALALAASMKKEESEETSSDEYGFYEYDTTSSEESSEESGIGTLGSLLAASSSLTCSASVPLLSIHWRVCVWRSLSLQPQRCDSTSCARRDSCAPPLPSGVCSSFVSFPFLHSVYLVAVQLDLPSSNGARSRSLSTSR